MRRMAWLLWALLLTGCATSPPATGLVWGYVSQSEAIPSLTLIAYSANRPQCEVFRARDIADTPKIAWAKMSTPTECRPMTVTLGTGYWIVTIPGRGAQGATERDWCEIVRNGLLQQSYAYSGRISECVSVSVATE